VAKEARIPTLSPLEALILELLRSREMYGLELVEGSGKRLKRGTVYVTLGRMEEKGYVESRVDEASGQPGLPRRLYRPTAFGRRVLDAWSLLRQRLAWEGAR
jgi:PadR family transcriptional regulator PadR